MKAKTAELLYLLLWSSEMLSRPSLKLTESFESWAYRKGFQRKLARLERLELLETISLNNGQCVYRLSEAAWRSAMGERDPEHSWSRQWDGRWRLVLFDVPVGEDARRNKLRRYLRGRRFGFLQHSVWVTPDPITNERQAISGKAINVESLILLEAHPCSGETDAEIVAGAWDFATINRGYARYRNLLRERPAGYLESSTGREKFQRWVQHERRAWLEAISSDPLLPACLLPPDYLGRLAWLERRELLEHATDQMRRLHSGGGLPES